MLTRVLALEWGHEGIRVNGIVPGPIKGTEGLDRLVNTPEAMEKMLASTPINRLGELEDVANMAMVLSTPLTSYVTGAIIPVDGGRTIAGGSDYGSEIGRRNA
jgi:NAD(P)-dependent dehydrogenase (short-subunit alcohol dehydrogenase family)